MKKYIQSSVYLLFVVGALVVLAFAITSYENPFSFYENPLVLLVLFALLLVVALKEYVNITAQKKAEILQMEKDGVNPDQVDSMAWINGILKKWTKAKSVETQEEIILDHNYDGIRELDNTLPPWWVYLFYATIVFAVVYLVRFEVLDGDSQIVEYEKEVAAAQRSLEKYKQTAPDLIDASSVVLLTDAKDLARGKAVFELNCAACHMADGGGGIGPNLTDKNWILGGGVKNVFTTISNGGRDGKGMIAWGKTLKPKDIAKVSSYILSLQGTTPANPKKAQGDVWSE